MTFFISNTEAERILNHKSNLLVKHSAIGSGNHGNQENKSGRQIGSKNYSTEIKALIGLLAKADGVKKTSENLGIAISQVSHYKNGKTQVKEGIKPDKELRNKLKIEGDLRSDELRDLVRDKVLSIVESIDAEKINKANLQTASKAASNLSSVFKNFTREENNLNRPTQQFVFYGIPSKSEDEYEILDAEVVNR